MSKTVEQLSTSSLSSRLNTLGTGSCRFERQIDRQRERERVRKPERNTEIEICRDREIYRQDRERKRDKDRERERKSKAVEQLSTSSLSSRLNTLETSSCMFDPVFCGFCILHDFSAFSGIEF